MTNPQGWNPKPIPPQAAKATYGKVGLKPEKFDALVDQQGVRVKVYRSTYCPNVKSIDGAEHELECPLCHGSGFIDRRPIETMAVIQNQALETTARPEGLVDGNTVQATFLQGVELQYFTLVELCDFTDVFFQRVKRQSGQVDVLRYPAHRVNILVDSSGKEYFEGSDFKLDANGNIQWCMAKDTSSIPDKGTIYSVHYEMSVRFRATKAAHVNRFAQVNEAGKTKFIKMNENWTLTKEYLVVRKDMDGKLLPENKVDEDYQIVTEGGETL